MKTLYYGSKLRSVTIPTEWNELDQVQLIKIAALLHGNMNSPELACDKLLQILTRKSLFSYWMIPVDLRMRMHEHVLWIFEDQNLTKQLIPCYGGLYGPDSDFNNLKLGEFHFSEMASYRFVHEQSIDALDELIAVLYREPRKKYNAERNTEGDIRVPFVAGELEWNKKHVRKWPLSVKQAIMLWYSGCREYLMKEYPTAFNKGSVNDYFDGMFGVIRNLSGGKYGNFDAVENMLVHNAFMEVVMCIEEEKELEEKLKHIR